MTLVLKIIVLIVVVLVVASAVLRIRKLRRDEIRELSRPVERRLVSPPPSPYEPSKGFRLLDGPLEEQLRPQPARPRLEADHDYVFSETQMPGDESIVPSQLRHNEKWALSKSARRSASVTGLRVAVIAIILVILLGAVGLYLQHHKSPGTKPPTTTTTTKHTTSSSAVTDPSSFTLASALVWSHVSN
ncbi:MAG TPA: hypothetical protein VII60_03470 [Acidimicrobiales bacterium]